MNILVHLLLSTMAFLYNRSSRLGRYLRHADGYFNFTVGFRSEKGGVDRAISFREGRARALRRVPGDADVVLRFRDDRTVLEMLRVTPNEMLMLILGNRMVLEGNIGYLQLFNFYISLIMGRVHRRMMLRKREHEARSRSREFSAATPGPDRPRERKREAPLSAPARDPGVLFLGDPYLSGYGLDDFRGSAACWRAFHGEAVNMRRAASFSRDGTARTASRRTGRKGPGRRSSGRPWPSGISMSEPGPPHRAG